MSSQIKFFKESTLPGTLEADAVYFIEAADPSGGSGDYAEFYVTDNAGVAHGVGTQSWVTAIGGTGGTDVAVASGTVTGTNLVLTLTDSTTVTVDVTALQADIRVTGGVFNSGTNEIDFTMSDSSTFSVPVAALLPITSDASLTGDGGGTPLSVAISPDANQGLTLNANGLYVDSSDFHAHTNKAELDKVTEDANGCQLYDGNYPDYWTTAGW